jgi:hypothetical protein
MENDMVLIYYTVEKLTIPDGIEVLYAGEGEPHSCAVDDSINGRKNNTSTGAIAGRIVNEGCDQLLKIEKGCNA